MVTIIVLAHGEDVCIYPTLPPRVGYDTKSIFKRSCLTKDKEPCQFFCLLLARTVEEMDSYLSEENKCELKHKQLRPVFELGTPIKFLTVYNTYSKHASMVAMLQ